MKKFKNTESAQLWPSSTHFGYLGCNAILNFSIQENFEFQFSSFEF